MRSHILTALALLGLLTFAIPITASAHDKHYNEWNKPAWAYEHPNWWRYYVNKQRSQSWYRYHPGYYRNHRWVCDADGDDCEPVPTYGRLNCDEDGDDCEPAPYYGERYMNPYRSYGPAYYNGYNGYGYPGYNNGNSDSWSYLLAPSWAESSKPSPTCR